VLLRPQAVADHRRDPGNCNSAGAEQSGWRRSARRSDRRTPRRAPAVARPHWQGHREGSPLCLVHVCASLARLGRNGTASNHAILEFQHDTLLRYAPAGLSIPLPVCPSGL